VADIVFPLYGLLRKAGLSVGCGKRGSHAIVPQRNSLFQTYGTDSNIQAVAPGRDNTLGHVKRPL